MALPKRSVGIVGLGIMGGAFARNLVAAGWHVAGFDIDAKVRRAAARAGVALTKDVPTLAAKVPVIITSLPHPDALHRTAAAMVAAKLKPRIVVETSTFALDDKLRAERMLRRAGHTLLDCPISGTGAQAKVKDIVVFASGEARAIRRLKPLFMGFARGVHDLGAFGNGSRMKYVANLLVAIHNVAAAEAMVLGIKAGLGPQAIFETIRTGAGNSRAFELRAPMMVAGRYDDATMKIAVWEKDMAVIGAFAKALRCPTPLFSATEPIYAQALRLGHGREDTAVVCAVLERKAGIRRRPRRRRR
ncbi:MAG: NAD(P)-dependent oxidoreductase [Hyphomicrobiales bacterium]|nr:NAD(P)-dependent oxidoreductase [Hyphomicrobiales bacterium]